MFLYTIDIETAEKRFAAKNDLAALARLADVLPNIDFVVPVYF